MKNPVLYIFQERVIDIRAVKPTRAQKEAINSYGFDCRNWLVERQPDFYIYIVHKVTNKKLKIDRYRR